MLSFDFFVVKRKEFLDLAEKPLCDAVSITVRPKSYLILGVITLSPSASRGPYISITCT